VITKHLGKIDSVTFGLGGYQESMLGIFLCFSFDKHSFVCTSKAFWDHNNIECTKNSKWTEQDRHNKYVEIMRYISDLLVDANVDKIEKLKNIPVEIKMDGNNFYSFRILTEVL
jgi:hypothetical protein